MQLRRPIAASFLLLFVLLSSILILQFPTSAQEVTPEPTLEPSADPGAQPTPTNPQADGLQSTGLQAADPQAGHVENFQAMLDAEATDEPEATRTPEPIASAPVMRRPNADDRTFGAVESYYQPEAAAELGVRRDRVIFYWYEFQPDSPVQFETGHLPAALFDDAEAGGGRSSASSRERRAGQARNGCPAACRLVCSFR